MNMLCELVSFMREQNNCFLTKNLNRLYVPLVPTTTIHLYIHVHVHVLHVYHYFIMKEIQSFSL